MAAFDYKAWYRQNKDRLNVGRRIRYRLERDYRDRVLETNRKSRQSLQELELIDRRNRGVLRASSIREPAFKTFIFDGVEYMTIRFLADFLGRGIQTLRAWEASGVIPPAKKKSPRGDRLYSRKDAEEIREKVIKLKLLTKQREGPPRRTEFLVRYKTADRRLVMELRSVAVLAKSCGRTAVAMRKLEKRGAIPETPLRYGPGRKRLYTDEMIDDVRQAFLEAGGEIRSPAVQAMFSEFIERAWRARNVFDMEILY